GARARPARCRELRNPEPADAARRHRESMESLVPRGVPRKRGEPSDDLQVSSLTSYPTGQDSLHHGALHLAGSKAKAPHEELVQQPRDTTRPPPKHAKNPGPR